MKFGNWECGVVIPVCKDADRPLLYPKDRLYIFPLVPMSTPGERYTEGNLKPWIANEGLSPSTNEDTDEYDHETDADDEDEDEEDVEIVDYYDDDVEIADDEVETP